MCMRVTLYHCCRGVTGSAVVLAPTTRKNSAYLSLRNSGAKRNRATSRHTPSASTGSRRRATETTKAQRHDDEGPTATRLARWGRRYARSTSPTDWLHLEDLEEVLSATEYSPDISEEERWLERRSIMTRRLLVGQLSQSLVRRMKWLAAVYLKDRQTSTYRGCPRHRLQFQTLYRRIFHAHSFPVLSGHTRHPAFRQPRSDHRRSLLRRRWLSGSERLGGRPLLAWFHRPPCLCRTPYRSLYRCHFPYQFRFR